MKYTSDKSWDRIEYLNDQAYGEITVEQNGKEVNSFNNIYNVMYGDKDSIPENVSMPESSDITRELKMRKFVEDQLLHTIAPILYNTVYESFRSSVRFVEMSPKYKDSNLKYPMILVSTFAMFIIGKMIKSKYSFTNTELKFKDICKQWARNLPECDSPKNSLKFGRYCFMSGTDEPGIADIEAFSLLLVAENTEIIEVLQETPALNWFNKMKRYYVKKTGITPEDGVMLMSL